MDAEDRGIGERRAERLSGEGQGEDIDESLNTSPVERQRPRPLPADLPRSLDDRKSYNAYDQPETEYYDAWQGAWPS